jgi:CHAD domain-containing protein
MLGRLRAAVDELDTEDREAASALIEKLASARDDAGERLHGSMSSARYERLLDRLVDAARDPRLRGQTDAPVRVAAAVMDRPWSKLRRAVDRIDEPARPEALHQVRIRAKRARYAAEAIQPAFGGKARTFAKQAAALQDVLGEHHDAIVLEGWLREASARARARLAFVAGELASQERRAADVVAAAWADTWRGLSRKRNQFWT